MSEPVFFLITICLLLVAIGTILFGIAIHHNEKDSLSKNSLKKAAGYAIAIIIVFSILPPGFAVLELSGAFSFGQKLATLSAAVGSLFIFAFFVVGWIVAIMKVYELDLDSIGQEILGSQIRYALTRMRAQPDKTYSASTLYKPVEYFFRTPRGATTIAAKVLFGSHDASEKNLTYDKIITKFVTDLVPTKEVFTKRLIDEALAQTIDAYNSDKGERPLSKRELKNRLNGEIWFQIRKAKKHWWLPSRKRPLQLPSA